MKLPIYLDYMATTPIDPRVLETVITHLSEAQYQGNSSSNTHQYGWLAQEAVEKARAQVASLVNADPSEIIWTSGGTESNNLAIKGAVRFYRRQGNHIITSKTEHKAVLDVCKSLIREGFEVTFLTPKANGLLDLDELKDALRDDTLLVSIMHANNEIGVLQDIQAIGEMTSARGVLFHVDAAQSAGKVPIDLKKMPVDLMSFSGHKIYGPKGIGALYIRSKPRLRLDPLFHGGGHERAIRPGTLAVHQVAGMGKAFEVAQQDVQKDHEHVLALRNNFWQRLNKLDGICLNGDLEQRLAGNLNFSVEGVDGPMLIQNLEGIAVSAGSACSSGSVGGSYVLRAIGVDSALIKNAIRLSFGRCTTQAEVDSAVEQFLEVVPKLRG
jgi:cysteine desulfurase